MSDAALIADLVRAGVDPELVGRVANALLDVRDNVRDKAVKEHERTRKRKWRETTATVGNSGGAKANDVARTETKNVPDIVPDNRQCATTLLPFLSLSLEDSVEKGSSGSKKARSENARARGQRMLAGAILTDDLRQAAIDLGAGHDAIPNMWAEFVDYWVGVPGQRGVKLDWPATWRNDVRRKLERGPRNGRAKQSLSDLAGDLAEQARSLERARGLI
jgi:hypothetical protein